MSTRTPDLQGQDALPALGSRYVDVDALPWRKGAGEGIEWKILLEDNERGLKTALIKWAPGASLPLHEACRHRTNLRTRGRPLRRGG